MVYKRWLAEASFLSCYLLTTLYFYILHFSLLSTGCGDDVLARYGFIVSMMAYNFYKAE